MDVTVTVLRRQWRALHYCDLRILGVVIWLGADHTAAWRIHAIERVRYRDRKGLLHE